VENVERSDWNATALAEATAAHKSEYKCEPFKKNTDRTTILLERTDSGTQSMGTFLPSQPLAARRSLRVGIKTKGKIVFIDLTEIIALEAEGNHVSLCHASGSYLIRESISTIAEKLYPFGFIRIHRCVLVNKAYIEELRRCATGVYLLRLRGGREYTITRTYKNNLRFLAESWLGTEI
jgi:DNA-binding LytR/AlgR family response regulator